MNAAAPYGAPVAIAIACVTAVVAVVLLAIGIAWARRATAPYGTHCKPRPPRERSPLRTAILAVALHMPRYWTWRARVRGLRARLVPALRGCLSWPYGQMPREEMLRYRTADPAPEGGPAPAPLPGRDASGYPYPALRDTAAEGFRVPQWAPENSYDGAEVTG